MWKHRSLLALSLVFPMAVCAADYDYGLMGITSLETIRLGATCLEDGPRGPIPCELEVVLMDRGGRPLKRSAATVLPGNSAFVDFRLPDGVPAGRRVEIVPCVRVLSGAASSNLQVLDNLTNRTRVFRNLGSLPAPAEGEVHFGLAGLTGFDTARVNAACARNPALPGGGDPCALEFIVHDLQGRILKRSSVTLLPGAGAFMDFRTSEAGLPARRGELIPCIRVIRGAALGTLEVFDSLTGLSTVFAGAAATLLP